jgi:hypothetical protein
LSWWWVGEDEEVLVYDKKKLTPADKLKHI